MSLSEFDYKEKQRLLHLFKLETLRQLKAIQDENPEDFLNSIEQCENIIKEIDKLNFGDALTHKNATQSIPNEKMLIQETVNEIIGIRKEISSLIPGLYEKLQRVLVSQRKKSVIKRGYLHEDDDLPPIFMDKKG